MYILKQIKYFKPSSDLFLIFTFIEGTRYELLGMLGYHLGGTKVPVVGRIQTPAHQSPEVSPLLPFLSDPKNNLCIYRCVYFLIWFSFHWSLKIKSNCPFKLETCATFNLFSSWLNDNKYWWTLWSSVWQTPCLLIKEQLWGAGWLTLMKEVLIHWVCLWALLTGNSWYWSYQSVYNPWII